MSETSIRIERVDKIGKAVRYRVYLPDGRIDYIWTGTDDPAHPEDLDRSTLALVKHDWEVESRKGGRG